MAFPSILTNAVAGVTEIQAKHINNIEAKVGIDGSAVVTSLDYLLKNAASINPGHGHTLAALNDVTALPAELNLLDLTGLTAGHVLRATGAAAAAWGAIQAGDLPTAIDAAKIADGSVSNAEFQYLNGVSAAIQTQLDGMAKLDGRATGQTLNGGAAASENLTLDSTAHATKGYVLLNPSGGNVGVNTAAPAAALDVAGTGQFAGLLTLQNKLALGTVTTQTFDIEIEEVRDSGLGMRIINLGTGTGALAQINPQSNCARLYQISHGSGRTLTRFGLTLGGWTEISASNGASGSVNGLVLGTQTAVPLVLGTNNVERIRIDGDGNIGLNKTSFGSSAAKVLALGSGTAPSSSPADSFQLYSADQAAGNACPHFRTENGAIIKLFQGAALTTALTTITYTAPGTPDYAVQDLTNSGGYGFVTKDEGNTVLSVIANLQARVNELESRLRAHGLLA